MINGPVPPRLVLCVRPGQPAGGAGPQVAGVWSV